MISPEEFSNLSKQIFSLEKRVDNLTDYLKSALNYLSSDPHSSLTKCRIVLEKILTTLYIHEMGKEPIKTMIGNILSDKIFVVKIPPRIRARMNFVREIANLGPHGGQVESEDANHVLCDTVYLVNWYISQLDKSKDNSPENVSIEIFSQLKIKYPNYLRPEITSVKFCQTTDRCYLEMSTKLIHDEVIRRTDLGFISEKYDDLYFDPEKNISDNAEKFIKEFDEISIINCTELFTEQAGTMLYENWVIAQPIKNQGFSQ